MTYVGIFYKNNCYIYDLIQKKHTVLLQDFSNKTNLKFESFELMGMKRLAL